MIDDRPVAALALKISLSADQVRTLLMGQTLDVGPTRLTADQDRELRRLLSEVEGMP